MLKNIEIDKFELVIYNELKCIYVQCTKMTYLIKCLITRKQEIMIDI